MLLWVYVRAHGGWWKYRQRYLASRHPLVTRYRDFVYTHYLAQMGSFIAPTATLAEEPRLPHGPAGIFIGPGVRVGRGVTIYQQVTIGINDIPDSPNAGAPVIGDDVLIGTNALVIGAVRVGDRTRIGAGAIVVKDVPEDSLAVSPAAVTRPLARRATPTQRSVVRSGPTSG